MALLGVTVLVPAPFGGQTTGGRAAWGTPRYEVRAPVFRSQMLRHQPTGRIRFSLRQAAFTIPLVCALTITASVPLIERTIDGRRGSQYAHSVEVIRAGGALDMSKRNPLIHATEDFLRAQTHLTAVWGEHRRAQQQAAPLFVVSDMRLKPGQGQQDLPSQPSDVSPASYGEITNAIRDMRQAIGEAGIQRQRLATMIDSRSPAFRRGARDMLDNLFANSAVEIAAAETRLATLERAARRPAR